MKFLDYIRGSREGQDANTLEKEAQTDAFLTDAIDGYAVFPDNDPIEQIQHIKDCIGHRRILSRRSRLGNIFLASIIFLIIGGGYFLTKNKEYIPILYQIKQYTTANIEESLGKEDQENRLEPIVLSQTVVEVDSFNIDTQKINIIEERVAEAFNNKNIISDSISSIIKSDTGSKNLSSKTKDDVNISINATKNKEAPRLTSPTKEDKASTESSFIDLKSNERKEVKVATRADSKKADIDSITNNKESVDKGAKPEILSEKKSKSEPSVAESSSGKNKEVPSDEFAKVPEPVIGFSKYKQYLKMSMQIPDSEDCKSKKGTVVLEFAVSENGKPTGIKVVKSLCPALDNEAIRLLEKGSDWTVTKQKGSLKVQF